MMAKLFIFYLKQNILSLAVIVNTHKIFGFQEQGFQSYLNISGIEPI